MKNPIQNENPRRLTKLLTALGVALLAAPMAFGASQTWTNAPVDNTWTNVGNWVGKSLPGLTNVTGNTVNADIVTFNAPIPLSGIGGSGAVNLGINPDGSSNGTRAREIGGITFDTTNCGAYYIGTNGVVFQGPISGGGLGGLSNGVLYVSHNQAIQINAPVTNTETFIEPLAVILPSSTAGFFNLLNNSTNASSALIISHILHGGANTRGTTFVLGGTNTGAINIVTNLDQGVSTVAGAGGIRKQDASTWLIAGPSISQTNVFASWAVNIQGGTLIVQDPGALGSLGSTIPILQSNATLQLNGVTPVQNFFAVTNGTIRANGSVTINGVIVGNQLGESVTFATTAPTDVFTIGNGGNQLKGGASDTIIHLAGPGTNLLYSDLNTITNTAWSIDGGVAQMDSGNALGASPRTLTFGSGSTGKLMLYGNSYTALAVTSSPTAGSPVILNGNSSSVVLTVSNAAANTFAGSLQDGIGGGNLGLTKAALGTLTLSGASTYTGNTTINNGILNVSGSLGSTAVTVNSGATLAGSGSVSGSVTLASGGTILPGGSASVGTFTVGSLTLNSGSSGSFDFNGTTNDLLMVSSPGGLTLNGGSVNLYQADGVTPFAATGTYNLIQYSGSLSGAAGNLTIGDPQAGYAYAFAASGGYIKVTITTAGVNTTWNVDADGSWTTSGNWSGGTVPYAAGDSAKLGVGSALRTVTLNAAETVGGLTFTNNNSFVIANAGNTLTLDNKGAGAPLTVQAGTANVIQPAVSLNDHVTATVASGDKLTLSGTVSATASQTLTVNGAGTLALSGNNSYGPSAGSYGTTVSGGGTLSVGNNNALGAGDVDMTGNSTLQAGSTGLNVANNVTVENLINATVDTGANTLTLSGTIGGNGSVIKNGSGTLVLTGNNSYAGITTVNSGVLSIAQDGNLGTAPSPEAPGLFLNGGDLLATANAGLNAQRDVVIGPVSGTVGTNALLDAAPGVTLGIGGAIYSAGNSGVNGLLVNTGSGNTGTVVLSGANSFTGPTYIAQGTLQLANAAALQNSVLDYTNGTLAFDSSITAATIPEIIGTQSIGLTNLNNQGVTLSLGGDNGSVTYATNFTDGGLGGALSKGGTGIMTLAGTNLFSGSLNIGGGEVLIPANGVSVVGSLGVTGNPAPELLINGGSLIATNATIAASGSGGPGNVVISNGSASFIGTISVNAATSQNSVNCSITVNSNASFNASYLTMGRGGLGASAQPGAGQAGQGLILSGGTAVITNNLQMGTAGANSGSSMSLNSGTLSVGGWLQIGANGGNLRWSVVDVDGASLTVGDTVKGILLGSGLANEGDSILLVRAGTASTPIITLGNTNYVGNGPITNVINVTGGALYIGSGGIVQPATNNVAAITLNGGIIGASADWTGTNLLTLGGGTIQTADSVGAAHNITWTGPIGGATNLIKTGAGTLTLTAGNYYTGGATLSAGTLNINGSWALGGAVYGGLTFNGGTLQFAPAFSGNGPGDFSENTAVTPVQVPVTFTANATIDVNGNTVACAYGIGNGGNGGLIVKDSIGGGLLNLQGANNYNGNTTVQSGTLALGTASINSATTVSIASGAKMQLNFAGNNIVSNLVLNGVAQVPGTYNSTTTPTYFTSGTGSLVVPVAGPGTYTSTPHITSFALVGANVVLNGTNGQAGDAYYLLSGTNLTQSVTQWRTVATNVFGSVGSSGAFNFTGTNAVTAGRTQQFYMLSNTNYNP
jgi:autotransporter-associated beta strand protein